MSKTRVFIYGSCVSRDTFEHFDPEQFELVEYVARQSVLSATTRPVELLAPPTLESRFQQRMVNGDFGSSLRRILPDYAEHVDVLLVDLTDERLGVYLLPDGTVLTRSVELIQSGAESELPQGTHHLAFGTQQHFEYWQGAIRALGDSIRNSLPHVGIALLDIPWAEWSESGQPTPDSFGVTASQANPVFRPYVEAAAQALGAHVISVDPSTVVSGPHHPWGDAPFHYSEDVYLDVVRQLTGTEGRIVWGPVAVQGAPVSDGVRMPSTGVQTVAVDQDRSVVASDPPSTATEKKPRTVLTFDADKGNPFSDITDDVKVIVARHGALGNGKANLIRMSTKHEQARGLVYELAAQGFHLYRSDGKESRFVRESHVPEFWHKIKDGTLLWGPEGLIHKVEATRNGVRPSSMAVVFSSMSSPHDQSSLVRFMEPNYKSLTKFVPDSTIILRVADMDAVVGGFYLNTHRHPDRTARVTDLISRVAAEHQIPQQSIVVYGASKGGTAAFHYGAMNGWNAVAVDPVLDDEHYETTHPDTHWTAGTLFIQRKRDVFRDLAYSYRNTSGNGANLTVITSPRSPQYRYIAAALQNFPSDALHVIRTHHPSITDHPHVSARTLPIASAAITMYLLGVQPRPTVRDIDDATAA